MAQNAFATYLAEVRPLIEEQLASATREPKPAGRIEEDLRAYLHNPYDLFVEGGGKRTRPALCLLGCEAAGGRREDALSMASAIEHFQAAALIHDDIADEGQLRRGKPCLYLVEGTGIAVNAGDLGIITAFTTVLHDERLSPEVRMRLLDELVFMEERTIEGQALDLGWVRDGRWDITREDYLFMARHKTAYYSGATPLAAGAIVAGATEEQVSALRDFGMDTGLAFQLQDDLMNLVGDGEAQGKDFMSDITEGKRTLVAVLALERLGQAEHDELVGILSSHTTDTVRLRRAVELFRESGAIDSVREYAQTLVAKAKQGLADASLQKHALDVLLAMADYFVNRNS